MRIATPTAPVRSCSDTVGAAALATLSDELYSAWEAVESALAGADASADAIGAAAEHAAEGTSAPSDLSGKADYREHLARVLTKRAVLTAAGV